MPGKNKFGKMLKQKKTRKLFRGMLIPLLTLTIVACGFFYSVSNQILKAYMEKQLELSVEKLNSSVVQSMQPIIMNVDNFTARTNIHFRKLKLFYVHLYSALFGDYFKAFCKAVC